MPLRTKPSYPWARPTFVYSLQETRLCMIYSLSSSGTTTSTLSTKSLNFSTTLPLEREKKQPRLLTA